MDNSVIANGQTRQVGHTQGELFNVLSVGYKPTLSNRFFWSDDGIRPNYQRLIWDVEAMLAHPRVILALGTYKAALSFAKFRVKSAKPEWADYTLRMIKRFWERSLDEVQQRSYAYGRMGAEILWGEERGEFVFNNLVGFFSPDCRVLTVNHVYSGFRVRSIPDKGTIDLWGPMENFPAKGFWYTHNRHYHRWYGMPQLFGAWRPWRRLAGRDAAEEILDMAFYKLGLQPSIGRAPLQDFNTKAQPAVSSPTGKTNPMDWMMNLLEQFKSGAQICLPNSKNPPEMGGDYKYAIEVPDRMFDVKPGLEYIDSLEQAIDRGIGVPTEIMETTGDTGSGFAGRIIPLEGYYNGQQKNARQIVHDVYLQIIEPGLHYNFGPEAWAEIEIESLLKSRAGAQGQTSDSNSGVPPAASASEQNQYASPVQPGRPETDPAVQGPLFATKADDEDDEIDEELWKECKDIVPSREPEVGEELGLVDGCRVLVVDGEEVMTRPDEKGDDPPHMDFNQAGNDLEANWIKREYGSKVFIVDNREILKDWKYNIFHEAVERREMAKGMKYDEAHEKHANVKERIVRLREQKEPEKKTEFATPDPRDPELTEVIGRALGISQEKAAQVREEILASVRSKDPEEVVAAIKEVLSRYTGFFVDLLTQANIAAALAGQKQVSEQLPAFHFADVSAPPASLSGESASALREYVDSLSSEERETFIQGLPEDHAEFLTEPPMEPWRAQEEHFGEMGIRFPVIDNAVADLQARNLMTKDEFETLVGEARANAFTVAGVQEEETLGKIRDALAGVVKEGASRSRFVKAIEEEIGAGTFLSDGHLENVYRTNVQEAYARGLEQVAENPIVNELFPYVETIPIRDDRLTELCRVTSVSGLNGTGIFRRDDPVWARYKNPRHYQCRCATNLLSIQSAAAKGVREAQEWERTGKNPRNPEHVAEPIVPLPPGWRS